MRAFSLLLCKAAVVALVAVNIGRAVVQSSTKGFTRGAPSAIRGMEKAATDICTFENLRTVVRSALVCACHDVVSRRKGRQA